MNELQLNCDKTISHLTELYKDLQKEFRAFKNSFLFKTMHNNIRRKEPNTISAYKEIKIKKDKFNFNKFPLIMELICAFDIKIDIMLKGKNINDYYSYDAIYNAYETLFRLIERTVLYTNLIKTNQLDSQNTSIFNECAKLVKNNQVKNILIDACNKSNQNNKKEQISVNNNKEEQNKIFELKKFKESLVNNTESKINKAIK